MPKESEREKMLKLQVNFMANFLINEKKISYEDAIRMILGTQTYKQLVNSKLYLNQSRRYVLEDLKAEILKSGIHQRQSKQNINDKMCQTCIKTHSLTRAIREMKVAKIEGRKLQSFDDFINEMRGV